MKKRKNRVQKKKVRVLFSAVPPKWAMWSVHAWGTAGRSHSQATKPGSASSTALTIKLLLSTVICGICACHWHRLEHPRRGKAQVRSRQVRYITSRLAPPSFDTESILHPPILPICIAPVGALTAFKQQPLSSASSTLLAPSLPAVFSIVVALPPSCSPCRFSSVRVTVDAII